MKVSGKLHAPQGKEPPVSIAESV